MAVVEVELQRKSTQRLTAILALYRGWIAQAKITGVVYVCSTGSLVERVEKFALAADLPPTATRIELLDEIRAQTTTRAA